MTASPGYAALREAAGLVDRRAAGVVVVAGPDARSFLQSLVSQDLDGVADGGGCASLLLQPTGKMGVSFRLLAVGDEFWLDTEPGFGAALASALGRFLIRVDVTVTDRSDDMGVLALRGPDAADVLARAGAGALPSTRHGHAPWNGALLVGAWGPAGAGWDAVGPLDALAGIADQLTGAGAAGATDDDWERARIEDGIPRLGVDLDEDVIPQEAGLEVDAVSFEKGCFLGQELVCRIHDRGHVNRHLRRLDIDAPAPPVGAAVVVDGKDVGALTSVVDLPEGGAVGLAYVRREVEPGSAVTVRGEGVEAAGRVSAVPQDG